MAPEQVMGTAVTPATDLYATGMIAYELLAGRHPYDGVDAPMALMLRHANDEPAPLGLVREDLPPGVVAWVHAMLAKDPAARPASAADAWDWLEGVVADELGPRWRRAAALPEPDATVGLRVGRDGGARRASGGAAAGRAGRAFGGAHAGYAGHALGNGDLRRAGPPFGGARCPRRRTPPPDLAAPARSRSSPSWPRPWSSPARRGSRSSPVRSRRPPRRRRLRRARRSPSGRATTSAPRCAPTGGSPPS